MTIPCRRSASLRTVHRLLIWLLLSAALPLGGRAQVRLEYSDEAEEAFLAGVGLYRVARYTDAAASFDIIIRDHPTSHRITAAYVLKGKAWYMANNNLESGRAMRELLTQFPTSAYTSDAHLYLGLVYQRIGRTEEAADEILTAWQELGPSAPPKLLLAIKTSLDTLIDASIGPASIQRRINGTQRRETRAFLWLKLTEQEVATGTIAAASVALDTLLSRYPESAGQERVEILINRIAQQSHLKLGILLPLMKKNDPSAIKEIGNEVYEGIQFAIEEFVSDPLNRVRVTTEVRDTERDPRLAAKLAGELANDPDVIGILGPVFSLSTVAAAETAKVRGIPLITPTATANAIAATGAHVFQANPDFATRGAALARFAVQTQGYKTLAALAPNDARGRAITDAFVREAVSLGARVIASEWYQRGTRDLKSQLTAIRHAGMLDVAERYIPFSGKFKHADLLKLVDLGIPTRRLDSLMAKATPVPAGWLLGANARSILDSLRIPTIHKEVRLDSLEYPVTSVQGLFAPIGGPEEIGVVSSQIVYFNFLTQVLGSMEWNTLAELDAHKRYCDGVVFESDTYIDSATVSYSSFEGIYGARFKHTPTRNSLYGYDVARLVLTAIRNGATSRGSLRNALAEVRDYRGLHSKIGLYPRRVNSWVPILRYKADRIELVEEMNVENRP